MSDRPISTWIWFQVPTTSTVHFSIFKPLIPYKRQYRRALCGPIQEKEGEYMLIIAWRTRAAYNAFRQSPEYADLMSTLESYAGSEPTTQLINVGIINFSQVLGVNTEVRTVYFPKSIAEEVRDKVDNIRGLIALFIHGNGSSGVHLNPYRGVPTRAFIEGDHVWNGESVVAQVWIHHWTSKEHETRFKRRERAWPRSGDTNRRQLTVDRFDENLRELGAIGWEEYHVDFEEIPKSLQKLDQQGTELEVGMMERLHIEPSRTE